MDSAILSMVKNELNISWVDPETDKKIARMIESGMYYLNDKAGEELDYSSSGYGQELLIEYVRYSRDAALDVFEYNFRSRIITMQNNRRMSRAKDAVPP